MVNSHIYLIEKKQLKQQVSIVLHLTLLTCNQESQLTTMNKHEIPKNIPATLKLQTNKRDLPQDTFLTS